MQNGKDITHSSSSSSRPTPNAIGVVGYGFVGRRIVRAALARGARVSVLTRTAPADTCGAAFTIGDAANVECVREFAQGIDHVIFAAGSAKPAESNLDPIAETERNLRPLLTVLDIVAECGVPHFTFLSSGGTVYGPCRGVPVSETTETWPITTYGVLKVAAERYVAMYAHLHKFSADILRCSNVYGPGQPTDGSQGVIGVFLGSISRGEQIRIYGDGSALRDFIHADDLADIILRLVDTQDRSRVLNVGSGTAVSIAEILRLVAEATGTDPTVQWFPARPADVPSVVLDVSRLHSILDFEPRSLRDGLSQLQNDLVTPR